MGGGGGLTSATALGPRWSHICVGSEYVGVTDTVGPRVASRD